ncbi:hypothetical protein GLI01_27400 [Gluconacetobacter liquefaciens]|nr:hypothetical protein GLI01_27400 [Gluconacetobacter liquefaciens]
MGFGRFIAAFQNGQRRFAGTGDAGGIKRGIGHGSGSGLHCRDAILTAAAAAVQPSHRAGHAAPDSVNGASDE